jgi:hypothetical protein
VNIRDGILALEKTAHHALMLALSHVHHRSSWFEFQESGRIQCLLCGRSIGDARDIWSLRTIAEHEQEHVDAMGPQKVAAAEMLYHLRCEEADAKVPGFILEVRREYITGAGEPVLITEGDSIPQFNLQQPKMRDIIEEVWGCIPSVELPDNNPQQGPRP